MPNAPMIRPQTVTDRVVDVQGGETTLAGDPRRTVDGGGESMHGERREIPHDHHRRQQEGPDMIGQMEQIRAPKRKLLWLTGVASALIGSVFAYRSTFWVGNWPELEERGAHRGSTTTRDPEIVPPEGSVRVRAPYPFDERDRASELPVGAREGARFLVAEITAEILVRRYEKAARRTTVA